MPRVTNPDVDQINQTGPNRSIYVRNYRGNPIVATLPPGFPKPSFEMRQRLRLFQFLAETWPSLQTDYQDAWDPPLQGNDPQPHRNYLRHNLTDPVASELQMTADAPKLDPQMQPDNITGHNVVFDGSLIDTTVNVDNLGEKTWGIILFRTKLVSQPPNIGKIDDVFGFCQQQTAGLYGSVVLERIKSYILWAAPQSFEGITGLPVRIH